MLVAGLIGGSPGPDAVASWKGLLGVLIFSVCASLLMLWYFLHVAATMAPADGGP